MTSSFTTNEFIKIASSVAENYGFEPVAQITKNVKIETADRPLTHTITSKDRRKDALQGLLTSGAINYCENNWQYIDQPVFSYEITGTPRTGEVVLTFHIHHVEKSIAESILIQAGRTLLRELGHIDHTVHINSLGDQESSTRYLRELTNFLRKRLEYLPLAARELMKENALLSLLYLIEKEHELAFKAPNPLEYLGDVSRKHFREIIEYLDISDAAYEIEPSLLGHHECYSDTIFAIKSHHHDSPLHIHGGRYHAFMRQHTNHSIPSVGAVLVIPERKVPTRISRPRLPQPRIFFVHLGFGPKIKSLLLIDEFRQAGLPVMHAIATDSLSTQLREAESKNCTHAVIMGQKEYVEGTVILRDMQACSQETILQDQLIRKLKRTNAITK